MPSLKTIAARDLICEDRVHVQHPDAQLQLGDQVIFLFAYFIYFRG